MRKGGQIGNVFEENPRRPKPKSWDGLFGSFLSIITEELIDPQTRGSFKGILSLGQIKKAIKYHLNYIFNPAEDKNLEDYLSKTIEYILMEIETRKKANPTLSYEEILREILESLEFRPFQGVTPRMVAIQIELCLYDLLEGIFKEIGTEIYIHLGFIEKTYLYLISNLLGKIKKLVSPQQEEQPSIMIKGGDRNIRNFKGNFYFG